MTRIDWLVPAGRGDVIAALHRGGRVLAERSERDGVRVSALVPAKLAGQLRKATADGEGGWS